MWDESRNACNAIEMLHNGNCIVTCYDGKPDLWNTKPPLLIWMQAASMKLFGTNELALRLPSAIAGLLTILLIVLFVSRYYKNYYWGLLSGMILATMGGYIRYHITRTGDYDGLLSLFTTLSVLAFLLWMEHPEKKRYIYITATGFMFAILTKSAQGIIIAAPMLLLVVTSKNRRVFPSNKHLYIAAIACLLPVTVFVVLREWMSPGYIQAALYNDITGRYFSVIEGHEGDTFYFLRILFSFGAYFWIWLLLAAPPFIMVSTEKSQNKTLIFRLFLIALIFLLIASFSKTKGPQYIVSLYPLIALICGYVVYSAAINTYELIHKNRWAVPAVSILILLTFMMPFRFVMEQNKKETLNLYDKESFGYFIKKCPEYRHYYVLHDGYNAALIFYAHKYNRENYRIVLSEDTNFSVGDTVMICEQSMITKLKATYVFVSLKEQDGCSLVQITGTK